MDSEVIHRFKNFNLWEEEKVGFQLDQGDIKSSTEECCRSLVGKIYGDKRANFTGLKNTLSQIWGVSGQLKIRELGFNLYQFVFDRQDDKEKILTGKSWTFDSQFLVLKRWKEDMDLQKEDFNSIQIWVQVWNLPNHWLSKETGLKFNHVFGNVMDVLIPENGSKKGRYLKLLVEINLDRPLLRGTHVKYNNQTVWVEFRYESMAIFCFYCGKVGHLEKNCLKWKVDAGEGRLKEGQYGDWLRAEQTRKEGKQNVLIRKDRPGGGEGGDKGRKARDVSGNEGAAGADLIVVSSGREVV